MMTRYWPLCCALALCALLAAALGRSPQQARDIPSPLLGRVAPALPAYTLVGQVFVPPRGRPWLLHVWASWCAGCAQEWTQLRRGQVGKPLALYGQAYRDTPAAVHAWLAARHGDVHRATLLDEDGRFGVDWGVYGVPETYVIDAAGRVAYKHSGPLSQAQLRDEILPRLAGQP